MKKDKDLEQMKSDWATRGNTSKPTQMISSGATKPEATQVTPNQPERSGQIKGKGATIGRIAPDLGATSKAMVQAQTVQAATSAAQVGLKLYGDLQKQSKETELQASRDVKNNLETNVLQIQNNTVEQVTMPDGNIVNIKDLSDTERLKIARTYVLTQPNPEDFNPEQLDAFNKNRQLIIRDLDASTRASENRTRVADDRTRVEGERADREIKENLGATIANKLAGAVTDVDRLAQFNVAYDTDIQRIETAVSTMGDDAYGSLSAGDQVIYEYHANLKRAAATEMQSEATAEINNEVQSVVEDFTQNSNLLLNPDSRVSGGMAISRALDSLAGSDEAKRQSLQSKWTAYTSDPNSESLKSFLYSAFDYDPSNKTQKTLGQTIDRIVASSEVSRLHTNFKNVGERLKQEHAVTASQDFSTSSVSRFFHRLRQKASRDKIEITTAQFFDLEIKNSGLDSNGKPVLNPEIILAGMSAEQLNSTAAGPDARAGVVLKALQSHPRFSKYITEVEDIQGGTVVSKGLVISDVIGWNKEVKKAIMESPVYQERLTNVTKEVKANVTDSKNSGTYPFSASMTRENQQQMMATQVIFKVAERMGSTESETWDSLYTALESSGVVLDTEAWEELKQSDEARAKRITLAFLFPSEFDSQIYPRALTEKEYDPFEPNTEGPFFNRQHATIKEQDNNMYAGETRGDQSLAPLTLAQWESRRFYQGGRILSGSTADDVAIDPSLGDTFINDANLPGLMGEVLGNVRDSLSELTPATDASLPTGGGTARGMSETKDASIVEGVLTPSSAEVMQSVEYEAGKGTPYDGDRGRVIGKDFKRVNQARSVEIYLKNNPSARPKIGDDKAWNALFDRFENAPFIASSEDQQDAISFYVDHIDQLALKDRAYREDSAKRVSAKKMLRDFLVSAVGGNNISGRVIEIVNKETPFETMVGPEGNEIPSALYAIGNPPEANTTIVLDYNQPRVSQADTDTAGDHNYFELSEEGGLKTKEGKDGTQLSAHNARILYEPIHRLQLDVAAYRAEGDRMRGFSRYKRSMTEFSTDMRTDIELIRTKSTSPTVNFSTDAEYQAAAYRLKLGAAFMRSLLLDDAGGLHNRYSNRGIGNLGLEQTPRDQFLMTAVALANTYDALAVEGITQADALLRQQSDPFRSGILGASAALNPTSGSVYIPGGSEGGQGPMREGSTPSLGALLQGRIEVAGVSFSNPSANEMSSAVITQVSRVLGGTEIPEAQLAIALEVAVIDDAWLKLGYSPEQINEIKAGAIPFIVQGIRMTNNVMNSGEEEVSFKNYKDLSDAEKISYALTLSRSASADHSLTDSVTRQLDNVGNSLALDVDLRNAMLGDSTTDLPSRLIRLFDVYDTIRDNVGLFPTSENGMSDRVGTRVYVDGHSWWLIGTGQETTPQGGDLRQQIRTLVPSTSPVPIVKFGNRTYGVSPLPTSGVLDDTYMKGTHPEHVAVPLKWLTSISAKDGSTFLPLLPEEHHEPFMEFMKKSKWWELGAEENDSGKGDNLPSTNHHVLYHMARWATANNVQAANGQMSWEKILERMNEDFGDAEADFSQMTSGGKPLFQLNYNHLNNGRLPTLMFGNVDTGLTFDDSMFTDNKNVYHSEEGWWIDEFAEDTVPTGTDNDRSYYHGLFDRTHELPTPSSATPASQSRMRNGQHYLRHTLGGMDGVELAPPPKKISQSSGGFGGGVAGMAAQTLMLTMPAYAPVQAAPTQDTSIIPQEQFDDLTTSLHKKEGVILQARLVETKKKGKKYLTIGHGHLLNNSKRSRTAWKNALPNKPYGSPITKKEAQKLYDVDIKDYIKDAKKFTVNFDKYSWELQKQIIMSTYRGAWGQSKNTRRLLKEGKFEEAAVEFLNRDDYRKADPNHPEHNKLPGIRPRMEEVAEAIRAEGLRRKNKGDKS